MYFINIPRLPKFCIYDYDSPFEVVSEWYSLCTGPNTHSHLAAFLPSKHPYSDLIYIYCKFKTIVINDF